MNVLTFDVEDWFHLLNCPSTDYESGWDKFEPRIYENVERILFSLSENNLKATFFCLGWICKKYPQLIKQIHQQGHDIGTHSNQHNLIKNQSAEEFEIDLHRSIDLLEDCIGEKVVSYRAPGFSFTKQTPYIIESLLKNGIEIDCSISSAKMAHGGGHALQITDPSLIEYRGMRLKEFPLGYFNFLGMDIAYSGGGYFRFFPYILLKYLFRKNKYNIIYFHPRDFDDNQPRIKELDPLTHFRAYHGLDKAFGKFNKLVKDFKLVSLSEAEARINWQQAAVYKF